MADLLASVHDTSASAATGGPDDNGRVIGLKSEELAELKEHAISWAAAHGLLVGWQDPSKTKDAKPATTAATFTHIPFCLLPVEFPKHQFERAIALSPLYGRLVDRVSRDITWLHKCLEGVVAEDEFTGRLLKLSKSVHDEGIQQKAYLGIHRSDYMLHEPQPDISDDQQRILQVELNTISSSFACISSLTSELHRFLSCRLAVDIPALETYYGVPSSEFRSRLPTNDAITELPNALAAAHKHYGVKDAIILFVVQPNEANAIDQRWLEYNLWEHHGIRVLRKTLSEVNAKGELKDNHNGKRTLVIDGKEVAVAYYRSAYTPVDYPTEQEWSGRTLIERSYAIKCPSIAYHLAGTKKVQQELANPAALRRFMSEEEAQALEKSFAGLYGLEKDSSGTELVKQMAIANPRAFVLKPQREGGGNNIYGDEVATAMQEMSPSELESYILMARIFPKENPAGSASRSEGQSFHVVYDPKWDRFFLEEDALRRGRKTCNSNQETTTRLNPPWDEWIVPPKSNSKDKQNNRAGQPTRWHLLSETRSGEQEPATNAFDTNFDLEIPAPGLSAMDSSRCNASHLATTLSNECIATAEKPQLGNPVIPTSSKKARIQSYADHFARANANLSPFFNSYKVDDSQQVQPVRWYGESLDIPVNTFDVEKQNGIEALNIGIADPSTANLQGHHDHYQMRNVYELKHLARICPYADGFRNEVNSACTFTALSSSSSSSSESEPKQMAPSESSEVDDPSPVFYRGDRVLFRAKQRWFKGKIRQRIKQTSFYDIKAANGSVFRAIVAQNIRLLEDDKSEPQRYHFEKGDRVLWHPSAVSSSQQTYMARIVSVQTLNRFDIQLRTGRIIKKVAHEELTPR